MNIDRIKLVDAWGRSRLIMARNTFTDAAIGSTLQCRELTVAARKTHTRLDFVIVAAFGCFVKEGKVKARWHDAKIGADSSHNETMLELKILLLSFLIQPNGK